MYFALTIIAAVLYALLPAFGATYKDAWVGPDKIKHLIAGAFVGGVFYAITGDPAFSILFAAIVGAVKEYVDMLSVAHTASVQDAVVTSLGGVLGVAVAGLLFPFLSRAVAG